jgi:hypothetical protein
MSHFRLHLISEPLSAYEFDDPRTMTELCDDIVRNGYCSFEGISSRLGNANQPSIRQTVFSANIARVVER